MLNFTQPRNILVYAGEGANYTSLYKKLKNSYRAFENVTVRPVTKNDLITMAPLYPQDTIAFFLPGGIDARYDERLQETGFGIIRDYVEHGGCFIGLCAGAYYASTHLQWQPIGKTLQEKTPSLRFFFGTASGPIKSLAKNTGIHGNWYDAAITPITCHHPHGDTFQSSCLYWDGPLFIPATPPSTPPSFETIATFDDLEGNPPAILKTHYGRGMAILSSIHPEVTHTELAFFVQNEYEFAEQAEKLASDLKPHDQTRERIWGALLSEIHRHRRQCLIPSQLLHNPQKHFIHNEEYNL